MAQGKSNAPSLSPIETAKAVLGCHPMDAVLHIEIGMKSLDWMETIFRAIEMLHENGGGKIHIKRLIDIGNFVAGDTKNLLDCVRDDMTQAIEAAEAQEGCAA